ncbi:MAG: ACP S-malonyltransferase [Pseudomonadota bacterium]
MTDTRAELGFVFPGQGSQAVGMLDALAAEAAEVRPTIEEASDALGYDLWRVIAEDPDETLGNTEVTQPAILAASAAIWRVWCARTDVRPGWLAGHSLGEYTALACAGALSLADAVTLVRDRGRFMQAAVPAGEGGMAAILGLTDEEIESCCAGVEGVVAPANYNSPGQVVIAGTAAAVDAAIAACKAAGAKRAVPVAMSVPSHSALLEGAAAQLGERLASIELAMPDVPVMHNVDAQTAADLDELRGKLVKQLYNPVRWTDCVLGLKAAGVVRVAECGPGKVLSGLLRRIDKSLVGTSLGSVAAIDELAGELA